MGRLHTRAGAVAATEQMMARTTVGLKGLIALIFTDGPAGRAVNRPFLVNNHRLNPRQTLYQGEPFFGAQYEKCR